MSGVLHNNFNPWFYRSEHAAEGRYSPDDLVSYNKNFYYLNPDIGGELLVILMLRQMRRPMIG